MKVKKRLRIPKLKKRKGLSGLYIRPRQSDGSRPYILLGRTRKEAENNYRDYVAQLYSNKSYQPNYRATIVQAMDYYLNYKEKRLYPTSFRRYKISIDNFKHFLRQQYPSLRYIDEIEPEHIKEFMEYRVDRGIKRSTVNQDKEKIYNFFKVLISHKKLIKENPVVSVEAFKSEEMSNPNPLTAQQINRILEIAKTHGRKIDWYPIFIAFYYTGMRRNELRFLTWKDIDFKNNKIIIRPKQVSEKEYFKPKTWQTRDIPIHPELLPVLQSLPKVSKWVFPSSNGKSLSRNKIYDEFQKILDKANITRTKVHILRHTWASHAAMAGVPLDVIQKIGGWKDRAVMDKYKHLQPDYMAKEFCKRSLLGGNNRGGNGRRGR